MPRSRPRKTSARRPRAPAEAAPEPAARPTLGQILQNLGPAVAHVVVAPRGSDVPAGEPAIYDAIERSSIDPEAIVLAVGVLPDGVEAHQLVADAAAAGAVAAVLKLHGRACAVSAEAEAAGLALIAIADEMSWSQLNGLLTHAVRARAPEHAVAGIAGVPMGDLFALANAIAALVGGAVTVEDPQARVLAYSNLEGQTIDEPRRQSILGRQVPDTPGVRALYRRLWAAEDVIRVDEVEGMTDLLPRIAIPVRAGDEILGSVWSIAEPTEQAKRALAEAARVAALHMINARASRDFERRMRGDLVRSLLEGRGSAEASAARLGIEPGDRLGVLAFELADTDPAQEELYRERLVDLIALYCEAFRRRAACASLGRVAYAVLPMAERIPRDRLMSIAGEILEHAQDSLRVPLRAAVGSTVALRDAPGARREVDRVLRVLATDPKHGPIASIDDVRSRAILLELQDLAAEHPQLVRGRIADVVTYDAEHGTAYVETLRAYLEAFGNVPAASAALDVHPNTFRYRLHRLLEVFSLDLDDPDERLVLSLQLRLLADDR